MKRGKARDVDKIPGFKGRIWGLGVWCSMGSSDREIHPQWGPGGEEFAV